MKKRMKKMKKITKKIHYLDSGMYYMQGVAAGPVKVRHILSK
jgi:hypothetical protein